MNTKKIICGLCGYLEERTDVKSNEVFFPNRLVYLFSQLMPHKCQNCANDSDMVVYGENYISGAFNHEIINLPHIIESNKIWREKQDIKKTKINVIKRD